MKTNSILRLSFAFLLLAVAQGRGDVAAPVFSVPGSLAQTTQFPVTITCATPDAVVRYAWNINPQTTDPAYDSPVTVQIMHSVTLRAQAYLGGESSSVTVATYTITGQVAAGDFHSVALRSDGTVWTWGTDTYSELGNCPGRTNSFLAAQVQDAPLLDSPWGNVVAVSAGMYNTLVLTGSGTAWEWGYGASGRLGCGTTAMSGSAQLVQSGTGVALTGLTAVSMGQDHGLALDSAGRVWWGINNYGQLGQGSGYTATNSSFAMQVVFPTSVPAIVAVSAGASHSIALDSTGQVWAWGYGVNGRLGNNATVNQATPVAVQFSGTSVGANFKITAIEAGNRSNLALDNAGHVWAWGDNTYGDLGNNTQTDQKIAVRVLKSGTATDWLGGIVSVSVGGYHSLAVDTNGYVWVWGCNAGGQLGDNTTTLRKFAVRNAFAGQVVQAAAGENHSVVLLPDGLVRAWGDNSYGELGNGRSDYISNSVPTVGVAGVGGVSGGVTHSLAFVKDGSLWTWGNNASGQLGIGSTVDSITPQQVGGMTGGVTMADAGAYHALAVTTGSTGLRYAYAWGQNSYGKLGIGSTTGKTSPQLVTLPGSAVPMGVSAGDSHSLFLSGTDGRVWATGLNTTGQLGDGTTTNRTSPVAVLLSGSAQLAGISQIAAGWQQSFAVSTTGTVYAWGSRVDGRLGLGTPVTGSVLNPTPVSGLADVFKVATGDTHTLALTNSGTVYGWGGNNHGQTGTGGTNGVGGTFATPSPVVFPDPQPFITDIATGGDHSLALDSTGCVYAWGRNQAGQLGLGDTEDRSAPVQIDGFTDIVAIGAGHDHSLAIHADGSISAWGEDADGQLGDGTYTASPWAVDTAGIQLDGWDDADGDGLPTWLEWQLGYDPDKLDTDGNGIPDSYEDYDNDGIPNIFEVKNGSDPADPDSIPTPTFVVDSTGGGDFLSLQAAIDAVTQDYQIIEVADGIYEGPVAVYSHKVLIHSRNGAASTALALDGWAGGLYVATDSVISGFTIRDGSGDNNDILGTGGNIFVDGASPLFERCIIMGGSAINGAAIMNNYGHPFFSHCTISGNTALDPDNPGGSSAISAFGYPVLLHNSILWNPGCDSETSGAGISAAYCIVRGGAAGTGNSSADPLFGCGLHLLAGSPAIDAASADAPSGADMDGEPAYGPPDIGADEYMDTDGDGIPDWWETLNAAAGLDPNNPADATDSSLFGGETPLSVYEDMSTPATGN